MTDLTREEFRAAVADAVNGLLNVYREVDAMLREFGTALASDEPRFKMLGKKLVPTASSRNPDARYLRAYHAAVFTPSDASEEDEEDEEDDEEGEEEDDGVTQKTKNVLTIETGSGILLARAAIHDRSTTGFEPNLVVAALTRCRVAPDVPSGTLLKVSRSRLRKIVRAMDAFRWFSGKSVNTLDTRVPVQIVGPHKNKHMLFFDVPKEPERHPLFNVTPDTIQAIAHRVRESWSASISGGAP